MYMTRKSIVQSDSTTRKRNSAGKEREEKKNAFPKFVPQRQSKRVLNMRSHPGMAWLARMALVSGEARNSSMVKPLFSRKSLKASSSGTNTAKEGRPELTAVTLDGGTSTAIGSLCQET